MKELKNCLDELFLKAGIVQNKRSIILTVCKSVLSIMMDRIILLIIQKGEKSNKLPLPFKEGNYKCRG